MLKRMKNAEQVECHRTMHRTTALKLSSVWSSPNINMYLFIYNWNIYFQKHFNYTKWALTFSTVFHSIIFIYIKSAVHGHPNWFLYTANELQPQLNNTIIITEIMKENTEDVVIWHSNQTWKVARTPYLIVRGE